MLNLQIPKAMLAELQKRANDYGFSSSEEFVHFVLKELLESIKNKYFTPESKKYREK